MSNNTPAVCPDCGGTLIGDGYTTVVHCENAEPSKYWDLEADASPVFCGETEPDSDLEMNDGSYELAMEEMGYTW